MSRRDERQPDHNRRGSAAAPQMYSEVRRGSGVPDVYSPERRGSSQMGGRNYGKVLL